MEIRVNGMLACKADRQNYKMFVNQYHNLFPNSTITVNDREVIFFEKGFLVA